MTGVLAYQTGFANDFATEAMVGALPKGQNSPQHVPYGLYAELISGSAFVAPRADNRRTWMYRRRPSAAHGAYRALRHDGINPASMRADASPNRLRWDPLNITYASGDFVDGLVTWAANGDPTAMIGATIYLTRRHDRWSTAHFSAPTASC